MHEFIVGPREEGLRLDVFLSQQDLSLSRAQIQRAVAEGRVLVNRGQTKAGHRLRAGDSICLHVPAARPSEVLPQAIPLSIVYEDPQILVLDKPAGMVVHPAPGHSQDTLVNAILFHCGDLSGIGGVLRPGIVHRLDKDTSGLLVVAKSDLAHRNLADQFKHHEVEKTYRAFVHGDVSEERGVIDAPLGRHPVERKKISTRGRHAREALTRWQVSERYGAVTLLNVQIITGRTHQIRVHLQSIGHPVVGDTVYGSARRLNSLADPVLRARLKALPRQALHASEVAFRHPATGEALRFVSALPQDMADLRAFLKGRASTAMNRGKPSKNSF